jgi:hypothetical protein
MDGVEVGRAVGVRKIARVLEIERPIAGVAEVQIELAVSVEVGQSERLALRNMLIAVHADLVRRRVLGIGDRAVGVPVPERDEVVVRAVDITMSGIRSPLTSNTAAASPPMFLGLCDVLPQPTTEGVSVAMSVSRNHVFAAATLA